MIGGKKKLKGRKKKKKTLRCRVLENEEGFRIIFFVSHYRFQFPAMLMKMLMQNRNSAPLAISLIPTFALDIN